MILTAVLSIIMCALIVGGVPTLVLWGAASIEDYVPESLYGLFAILVFGGVTPITVGVFKLYMVTAEYLASIPL